MRLSKPSDFYAPHLIYDPIRKDAIVVNFDEVIPLTGPFANYAEANTAMHAALEKQPRRAIRQ
jgi:hypothetical protein